MSHKAGQYGGTDPILIQLSKLHLKTAGIADHTAKLERENLKRLVDMNSDFLKDLQAGSRMQLQHKTENDIVTWALVSSKYHVKSIPRQLKRLSRRMARHNKKIAEMRARGILVHFFLLYITLSCMFYVSFHFDD